jgi:DNA ligase (NAD+)
MKAIMALDSRVEQLKKIISYHAEQYHTHDSPEISDDAYDALVREMISLEGDFSREVSRSQKVGGKILDGFIKTKHLLPQWSYDNVFGRSDLKQWDDRN